ncbi:hypothetical protein ACSPAH_02945 [Buttiauxella agrestis]
MNDAVNRTLGEFFIAPGINQRRFDVLLRSHVHFTLFNHLDV